MCLDDGEAWQENDDLEICDIDKMWDTLHFLLTGNSASEPTEDDLISEAIVGSFIYLEKILKNLYLEPRTRVPYTSYLLIKAASVFAALCNRSFVMLR